MNDLIQHLERYAQGMRDAADSAERDAVYADYAYQDRDRAKGYRRDAAKYQRWADMVRKLDVFAAAMASSKDVFVEYAGHTDRIYIIGAHPTGINYQTYEHAREENKLLPSMDAKQHEIAELEKIAKAIRDLENV